MGERTALEREAREGFEVRSLGGNGGDCTAATEVEERPADVGKVLDVTALKSKEPRDDSEEGVEQDIARSG